MKNEKAIETTHITLEKIKDFQSSILNFPQEECPLKHRFIDGVYSREIFMRAGLVVTSKIHKKENISILLTGEVLDITESEQIRFIKAPHVMIVPARTKRVLYIKEDTTWITFHPNPNNKKDLEEIEIDLIEPENDLLEFYKTKGAPKCLG